MATLGSLFDGSGGFPLAGALNGITPLWASEIEMYPIAVTRSRFPGMEHLGNVMDIHGDKIQPVDVITFGSPCQDLSIAGKRAGIHDGQRSNLFFEAIRIIKEMREATSGEYPKFAVWENVPGAFSSNQGEDFRCVLEAFAGICAEGVSIPRPKNGGGAGEIMGDGYSVAWRTLDAQYWGVPQRRKRIYLVADFRGESAGKILFERKSVSGDIKTGGETGQGTAQATEGGTGRSDSLKCLNPWDCQSKRIFEPDGIYPTLPAMDCGGANNQAVLYALDSLSSNSMKSANPHSGFHAESVAKTLQAGGVDPTCNQGGNVIVEPVYVLQGNGIDRAETAGCNGKGWREDVCYTLDTIDRSAICFKAGQGAKARSLGASEKVTPTLGSEGGNSVPSICYGARGNDDGTHCPTPTGDHENRVTDCTAVTVYRNPKFGEYVADGMVSTMLAHDSQGPRDLIVEHGKPPRKYIVRRLTPLECNRLQGFPDGWGIPDHKDNMSNDELLFWQGVRDAYAKANGKSVRQYKPDAIVKWYNSLHTDSAEYKMWGNGIALPCAEFVLGGIAAQLRMEG